MRIFTITLLLFLAGCAGPENEKIELDKAKDDNPLLVPPCLKK